jgi:hypothetical protein
MSSDAARASSLATAARAIVQKRTLAETLDAIVLAARDALPGFDHVGLALLTRTGEVETKAATDPLVRELDHLQYTAGEGPCLSALRETPVVVVPDLRREQRWPRYRRPPSGPDSGPRWRCGSPSATRRRSAA